MNSPGGASERPRPLVKYAAVAANASNAIRRQIGSSHPTLTSPSARVNDVSSMPAFDAAVFQGATSPLVPYAAKNRFTADIAPVNEENVRTRQFTTTSLA